MLKALNAQSIASRLFLSAAFWSSTILIVAGLGLSALNARSTEANFDEQLGVYLKALVANVAIAGDEAQAGASPVIDPQFELAFSGWYWQITRLDARSPGNPHLALAVRARNCRAWREPARRAGAARVRRGYVVGPGDAPLRMIEREIDAGEEGRYLIQVAANADVIQTADRAFRICARRDLSRAGGGAARLDRRWRCASAFARCGCCRRALAAIRRGEAERISGEFPQDVAPLAAEVNLLLDANRDVVERARTQVGNLAHALKTPLSVIVNEADSEQPEARRQGARAGRRDAPAGELLSRSRARRGARRRRRRGDRSPAGDRRARAHLREGLPRPRAHLRPSKRRTACASAANRRI